ncbi:hypothetical protein ACH4TS_27565 [Streptomyces albidoflavus]
MDKAWQHLKTAITDLDDPDKTWTVHAGLVAGVIGVQSQLADRLWEKSRALAGGTDLRQVRHGFVLPP